MNGIGRGIDAVFMFVGCLLILFIPLGMWKLIEVIIWAWSHVHFGVTP